MVSKIKSLKCVKCGSEFDPYLNINFCLNCGSILEFQLNYDYIKSIVSKAKISIRDFNMWRYREFIPIENYSCIVSMGEGWTPLIRSRRLGSILGLKNLFLKLEYLNPTGSFKDRGSSAAVSRALELKAPGMVGFSTGNAGVAQAAYCALANIESIVFAPKYASREKIASIMIYGSRVFLVNGTFDDASRIARIVAEKLGWIYNGGVINPIRQEGKKTLAYEICEQLGWKAPDWYIQSVGMGTAAIGAFKGFKEMVDFDWINGMPRMACVQAEGCAPMVKAFKANSEVIEVVKEPKTIASAIAVGNPAGWPLLYRALKECNGIVEAVSDDEIIEAYKAIAKFEGIYAEPAAAAPLALVKKLREFDVIDANDLIVCVISGFGLKDVSTTLSVVEKPIEVSIDIDEVLSKL
ncbi:MAG: threonine synthase [Candidatus Methanomethylicia archaeon]